MKKKIINKYRHFLYRTKPKWRNLHDSGVVKMDDNKNV